MRAGTEAALTKGVQFVFGALVLLPIVVALAALMGWVIGGWWFPRTSQLWLDVLLPWEGVKLYQVTALASVVLYYAAALRRAIMGK